tara:strand:+ start:656 stop:901 length:246 start_codon:yes stop_codon:yes gene_type:complete
MFIEIGLALAGAGGYVIYRIKSKKIEETELNVVKPKKIENNYFICLQCNKRVSTQDIIFYKKWPFCTGNCVEVYKQRSRHC